MIRPFDSTRFHYTAKETGGKRWKQKLLGKTTWYRKRRGEDDNNDRKTWGPRSKEARRKTGSQELKTRAVLFVPQTPMGELARRSKEIIQKMEHLLKFKLKVVERAGVSLKSHFSQSSIMKGMPCGRQECIPCGQEGEEIQECTKSMRISA